MRCLSPHPNYSIQIFEGKEQVVLDARGYGEDRILEKSVIANFDTRGLADHEIEAALTSFNFSGLPDGVNPLTRISSFDTEAFVERFPAEQRDAMKVNIDKRLLDLQAINPSQFIIVEAPKAEKPWPSYDRDTVEDVLKLQERLDPLGQIAEAIRRYEEENKNRKGIVEAMKQIEDPEYVSEFLAASTPTPQTPNPVETTA